MVPFLGKSQYAGLIGKAQYSIRGEKELYLPWRIMLMKGSPIIDLPLKVFAGSCAIYT